METEVFRTGSKGPAEPKLVFLKSDLRFPWVKNIRNSRSEFFNEANPKDDRESNESHPDSVPVCGDGESC